MHTGTDVDYGSLTRLYLQHLTNAGKFNVVYGSRVINLRPEGKRWIVEVRNEKTGEHQLISAKFVFAGAGDGSIELRLALDGLRQPGLRAAVQHRDDRADYLEVAELLCGDIKEHVLSAGVVFCHGLGEIPACGSQFALRAAKLLQQQVGQARVRGSDTYGVLKAFVVANMVSFL